MKLLASVKNLSEARIAKQFAVDFIDLKQPESGALGALELNMIEHIVTDLQTSIPISATLGDLPFDVKYLMPAIYQTVSTHVNYIKIGLFPGADYIKTIEQLAFMAHQFNLIAVFFADDFPGLHLMPILKTAGFKGVMLDTVNKSSGSLIHILSINQIKAFVSTAHAQQLMCGLAGSLKITDIDLLAPLHPDYLGFRGALCHFHQRTATINTIALQNIQQYLTQF